MAITAIAVVGAGTMGSGIAHVAAQSGFEVLLLDRSPELVERGLERIGQLLSRGVDRRTSTSRSGRSPTPGGPPAPHCLTTLRHGPTVSRRLPCLC